MLYIIVFVGFNVKRYGLIYYKTVDKIAKSNDVNTNCIMAVIRTESSFNKSAVSEKGAVGLMQLMPKTAEWLCKKYNIDYKYESLFDLSYNVDLGCKYLNYLFSKFDFNWAIVAYNAGENNVSEWVKKGISIEDIPFKESKNYLKKVLSNLKYYNVLFDS